MDTSEIVESVGIGRKPAPAPKKFTVISFDDLGYEGWEALAWYNAPSRYYTESLQVAQDAELAIRRILELVPEWNFPDENGETIPHTAEGLNSGALPTEVLQEVFLRARKASQEYRGLDPQSAGSVSPSSPGSSSPTAEENPLQTSPSPEPSAVTA